MGAQTCQILRYDEQHDLLADGTLLRLRRIHTLMSGLPTPPERQVKDRHGKNRSSLEKLKRTRMLGDPWKR